MYLHIYSLSHHFDRKNKTSALVYYLNDCMENEFLNKAHLGAHFRKDSVDFLYYKSKMAKVVVT